jgi:hypothetical protein
MIRKIVCSLVLAIVLNVFSLPSALSEQIAVTEAGREVILEDSGTWRYADEEIESVDVVALNEDIKIALRPYIESRNPIFANRFDIFIDWELASYEDKYIQALEGFYRAATMRMSHEVFRDELIRSFGGRTAEKIIWMLEHWNLWRRYCT